MLSPTNLLRRRPAFERFVLRLLGRAVVALVVGIAAAGASTWADHTAELWLPYPIDNARLILGTLAGAILTIAVFALWMRTVVVGLAAGQAPPRVVAGYLDDAFQHSVAAWMIAAFAYVATVTVTLPSVPEPGLSRVPAVSAVLAVLATLAAFITVLVAMRQAVNTLSMPQVIRSLTDSALTEVRREHEPAPPTPPDPPAPGHGTTIRSQRMGWVQWIDHPHLLKHLPADTVMGVQVNVSEFVTPDEPVAHLDREVEPRVGQQLESAFTLVPARTGEYDLAYTIQQLVDIAEHAMNPGSLDTSTVYEALVHLQAVLGELIRRGTAPAHHAGDQGRWVVRIKAWAVRDYLDAAFRRLVTGVQDPTTAQQLHAVVRVLEGTARREGDGASADLLQDLRTQLEERAGAPTPARHFPATADS